MKESRWAWTLLATVVAWLLSSAVWAQVVPTHESAMEPSSASTGTDARLGMTDELQVDVSTLEMPENEEECEPPPGTGEGDLAFETGGCSGACYVEMACDGPGFLRYVGCYGGHSSACQQWSSYVICDGIYYSCEQCAEEQPNAFFCEFGETCS